MAEVQRLQRQSVSTVIGISLRASGLVFPFVISNSICRQVSKESES
jgi:hypothetical protein